VTYGEEIRLGLAPYTGPDWLPKEEYADMIDEQDRVKRKAMVNEAVVKYRSKMTGPWLGT